MGNQYERRRGSVIRNILIIMQRRADMALLHPCLYSIKNGMIRTYRSSINEYVIVFYIVRMKTNTAYVFVQSVRSCICYGQLPSILHSQDSYELKLVLRGHIIMMSEYKLEFLK